MHSVMLLRSLRATDGAAYVQRHNAVLIRLTANTPV